MIREASMYWIGLYAEAYSETRQRSKMEFFAVNYGAMA